MTDAELDAALERMCEPLDESRLSGVTAQEDARCMKVIRDAIAALRTERDALRQWLDSNTTFYDVDADWPVEGPNIPTLAQVSNRIWYHATDDTKSYPFSAVIDAAMLAGK